VALAKSPAAPPNTNERHAHAHHIRAARLNVGSRNPASLPAAVAISCPPAAAFYQPWRAALQSLSWKTCARQTARCPALVKSSLVKKLVRKLKKRLGRCGVSVNAAAACAAEHSVFHLAQRAIGHVQDAP
jgi:hypothetical protein